MVPFAHRIKKAVQRTPVIAAGRIQTPESAGRILEENQADLIGLARVLFADPLWPKKAEGILAGPIVACEPSCSLCMGRVATGKPAFCSQWDRARQRRFLERIGEKQEKA